MPYPNTHTARVADPDGFVKESFRTKELKPGLSVVVAKRSTDGPMQVTSYHFDATKFSSTEARKWLSDHDVEAPLTPAVGRLSESNDLPGVASVALMHDQHMLMGKRRDNGKWTHPGGHLEAGESPLDGACRELSEESGIKVDKKDLHHLTSEPVTTPTGKKLMIHAYLCEMSDRPETTVSEDPDKEVHRWHWINVADGLPDEVGKNLHSPDNILLQHLDLQESDRELAGTPAGAGGFFMPDFVGRKKYGLKETEMLGKEAALDKQDKEPLWYGLPYELSAATDYAVSSPGGTVRSTIEIARYGKWNHPDYGAFEFNQEKFQAFIDNFNNNVRRQELPLDVEHKPENGAAAWFAPGTMRQSGDKLLVDVDWTAKGFARVKDDEYKYCSITFRPNWTDPETDKTYNDVVFGAAITTNPFVKGMRTIQDGLPMAVCLSEFSEGDIEMADTKFPYSKGALDSSKETAGAGKLPEADDDEGRKDLPEDGHALADKQSDGDEDDMSAKTCDETTSDSESYDEPYPTENMDAAYDSMSAESLAEHLKKIAKKLAEKTKGTKGAPMVRQHLKATHELMKPVLDRLDAKNTKEETKMSEIQAASAEVVQTLTDNYRQLADKHESQARELAELREERRHAQAVALAEKLFPRKGFDTFKLPADENLKTRVIHLFEHLSTLHGENGLVKLSEGKTANAAQELMEILNSIPDTKLHGKADAGVSLEDSEGVGGSDLRLHQLTESLVREKGLSYAEAAVQVAKGFKP